MQQLMGQQFHGDIPFKVRIVRQINGRHAAPAQFRFNLVSTNLIPQFPHQKIELFELKTGHFQRPFAS
jgi:hypothetical protein